jgi:hypothetical protein
LIERSVTVAGDIYRVGVLAQAFGDNLRHAGFVFNQ